MVQYPGAGKVRDSAGDRHSLAHGFAAENSLTSQQLVNPQETILRCLSVFADNASIHELSGAELDEMKAAGATLVDAWIEKANGDGLDGAALVETARSLVAKYAD